jgi:Tfp pilus assembly protein PilX
VRKKQLNPISKQRGYLVILLVIMIIIVGFIGAVVTNIFFSSTFATTAHYQSDLALYLAEAGLEHATHKLLEPTIANRLTCAGYNTTALTNTLGAGAYSVSAGGSPIYASSPTALSGAISAAATSIPVVNTAGYATSGRIMIDSELINYNSITSTSFNSVTRGVDGSTPVAHVTGTSIGQYQCNLTSVAGVPTIAASKGKRSLSDNVQLQEAWVIGDTDPAGNFLTAGDWNNPTEAAWNNVSQNTGAGFNLNGVFFLSYADGWFVGDAGNFIQWNGNIGSVNLITVNPSVNYNSVFCTATNNCHAVGDRSGPKQVILDWDGSNWTRITVKGVSHSTNLKSIHCDSSTDCWAIGDNNGGNVFYHGTGGGTWTGITETLTGYAFNGVFCNAANDCWAVGSNASFGHLTSGTTWANYPTGLPAAQYNSIFCNDTSDCWAVANVNGGKDLFAHWDGFGWSRNASNPTPIANLNAVSCYNKNDCWAAGATSVGNNPAFVHWDGNSWTQFTNISGGAFTSNTTLRGLSLIPISFSPTHWVENFP